MVLKAGQIRWNSRLILVLLPDEVRGWVVSAQVILPLQNRLGRVKNELYCPWCATYPSDSDKGMLVRLRTDANSVAKGTEAGD